MENGESLMFADFGILHGVRSYEGDLWKGCMCTLSLVLWGEFDEIYECLDQEIIVNVTTSCVSLA